MQGKFWKADEVIPTLVGVGGEAFVTKVNDVTNGHVSA